MTESKIAKMTDLPPVLASKIAEIDRIVEAYTVDLGKAEDSVASLKREIAIHSHVRQAYLEAAAIYVTTWSGTPTGRQVAEAQAEHAQVEISGGSTPAWFSKKRRSPTETREAVLAEFQKAVWPGMHNGLDVVSLVKTLQIPAAAIENAIVYLERNNKIDLIDQDGEPRWKLHPPSVEIPPSRNETTEQRVARIAEFIRRNGDTGVSLDQLRVIHAIPHDISTLLDDGVIVIGSDDRYRIAVQRGFDPLADLNSAAAS